MTQTTLLHLPGTFDPASQWRAQAVQLVNWGGFDGHTRVAFDPQSTLISGASGTGKSTMLDAWLAVMSDSKTPFNGASNDANGHARGATQRNVLTYVRGKTGTTTDTATHERTDKVLRGANTNTWGALALNFTDGHGNHFTAGRIYNVPRGATAPADVTTHIFTVDGPMDLRQLERFQAGGFAKRALEDHWQTLTVHPSYKAFAQTMFIRLGIGDGGDGFKALRLHARVQAGQSITSVDALYKNLVLERPGTYGVADTAVAHFTDLDTLYETIQTAALKRKLLTPMTGKHAALTRAQDTAAALDTLGVTRDGDTPLTAWALRYEGKLLDTAADTNRAAHRTRAAAATAAAKQEAISAEALRVNADDQRANGGDQLEELHGRLGALHADTPKLEARHARFTELTAVLGLGITTDEELRAAQDTAGAFDTVAKARRDTLATQRADAAQLSLPLHQRRAFVRTELESLRGRSGLVTHDMVESRRRIAEAAGLDPAELPYVAELLDLAPESEQWRAAVEIHLHGFARQLLVNDDDLRTLSAAVDTLKLRRTNFSGVGLVPHTERNGAPGHISGTLVHKDSPFSSWVSTELRRRDARCVHTIAELDGAPGGPHITVNGQTRRGRSGAAGQYKDAPILGFDNTTLIADYETELADLDRKLGGHDKTLNAVSAAEDDLRAQEKAHQHVEDTTFEQIDTAGHAEAIGTLIRIIDAISAGNDVLAQLVEEGKAIAAELGEVRANHVRAKDAAQLLQDEYGPLCERQDHVSTEASRHEDAGIGTTPEQDVMLLAELARAGANDDHRDLAAALARMRVALSEHASTENARVVQLAADLCDIMASYQSNLAWYDPNRSTTLVDYPIYAAELAHLESDAWYEQSEEWRRRQAEWSGEDLLLLQLKFSSAIADIENRLEPVNAILSDLPFGACGHTLRIQLRRLTIANVASFKAQLTRLTSNLAAPLDDDAMDARFTQLRELIARIRPPAPGARNKDRDQLLDVREQVEITALELDAGGVPVATYAHLSDKSGGENQELIAFIVGAALRFQLGDEDRPPRFAPIVLDEGFIKSDGEFTSRAVTAWKGFGFQLIVGAPLDKVTSLEPSMDTVYVVTKNAAGYSFLNNVTNPGVGTGDWEHQRRQQR